MISIFPESALHQLEFNKIGELLEAHAQSAYAKEKARRLRIHTRKEYIELELRQSHEYKLLLQTGLSTPNDQVVNLEKELKLLAIPGAVFSIEQCVQVRKLLEETKSVFQWFQPERRINYAGLAQVLEGVAYEKKPLEEIQAVLEEQGGIRDNASAALLQIRSSLSKKRSEVRRVFERVIQKWSKAGYVADVEEAFLNGRRVIAVTAEHKRQVKGILLGESDTRKTAFLEPEETIALNNDVLELEGEESREVYRILRQLTETLSRYTPLLQAYHRILGELDFIRAKARLAQDLNGNLPKVSDVSRTELKEAYHPLLIVLHKATPKLTVPINLKLDDQHRILVISGPNAGGKTVTLKTVGLLQLMAQSGLLIPVHPDSEIGIYKKLMIHIGDTQSLEFELSTYSSHLKNMKHFIEESTGRTLFFIDELGSGSDPSLGGAFAEVILEELVRKHAQGIVTTHYLNLKIMAGKTPGIQNAAMAFDEKNLLPLFQLIIGKPGSSYTFSIAERIGLDPRLIGRARQLVDEGHFRLDKLLNKTEQEWQQAGQRNRELKELLEQNEKLKKELELQLDRERHRQKMDLLRQQNRITEERLQYLKEMERKLKQITIDWKKAEQQEDKRALIRQLRQLLFTPNPKKTTDQPAKPKEPFTETQEPVEVGKKVRIVNSTQTGQVIEIRGRKVVVQVGNLPMILSPKDIRVIQERPKK